MNLKTFKKIIRLIKKQEALNDNFYKLGLSVYPISESLYTVVSLLFKAYYSEIGEDYISWWLYEDVEKIIYLEDGREIDLTKVKDLWLYVENIRKLPDFKEYTPKKKKLRVNDFKEVLKSSPIMPF